MRMGTPVAKKSGMQLGLKIPTLETLLGDPVNILSRTIHTIKLLVQLLFVFLDKVIGCLCVTSDTDNLVLCNVRMPENGRNIAADIIAGGEGDKFLSSSRDDSLASLKLIPAKG
jgi:hypothetical protein